MHSRGDAQVKALPRDLTPGPRPRSLLSSGPRQAEAASGLREERGRLSARGAGREEERGAGGWEEGRPSKRSEAAGERRWEEDRERRHQNGGAG